MELYDYLRTQFTNLEEAKIFFRKWAYGWRQNIPGHPEFSVDNDSDDCSGFSLRAMAGHISAVLTGNVYDGVYNDTKYGSEIYLS